MHCCATMAILSVFITMLTVIDVNPKKGTHCCIFMPTMVMPPHHNVTLYVKCLLVFDAINITK